MRKLILTLSAISFLTVSCEKDHFSAMNQDPTQVNKPDVTFLLAKGLAEMSPNSYTEWFYDNTAYILPWTQATLVGTAATAPGPGNSDQMNNFDNSGNRKSKLYNVYEPLSQVRHSIDNFKIKKKKSYQKFKAITYPIQIYMGIRVTDVYGPEPYTEAMKGRYTNPPLLNPKWDSQKKLLNTWLKQLNKALATIESKPKFEGNAVKQVSPSSQDFIYGGNFKKWGKFINTLKLSIAVRLLEQNKQKAIGIAEAVANDNIGPITNNADNFNYTKGKNNPGPNKAPDNNIFTGPGGKNLIKFLRENKDPRLRFLYNKNDFNSYVIQGFYDAGKKDEIPSYIQRYTKNKVKSGNLVFAGWKKPGAPWVRYIGAPVAPDSTLSGEASDEYFNTQNLKLGSKDYTPTSLFALQLFGTHQDYTYPDVPGNTKINDKDVPFHDTYASAGESNLYLAEFKVLGANLPKSAETYFQDGIKQSVHKYDRLANKNSILYYEKPYDTDYGAAIKLKSGEIQSLLSKPAYTLDGSSQSEKLNKIYIQEYVNFLGRPNQLFVTSRRSGIPETNGKYFSREPFWSGENKLTIPRRFSISEPVKSSSNYDHQIQGIKNANLTPGADDPQTLHDERLYYDKNAPDWGEGPNY